MSLLKRKGVTIKTGYFSHDEVLRVSDLSLPLYDL